VAIGVAPEVLARYAGTYQFGAGSFIYVKFENGVLLGSNDNAEWAELCAESETRFFVKGETIRIEFANAEGGVAPELVLEIEEGAALRATRVGDQH
jgi:hypothetical protein